MKYSYNYIDKWLDSDYFANKLMKISFFSKIQLKDYVSYIWNKEFGDSVTVQDIAEHRLVTKQAISDNIRLAKANIDKSMATFILGIYANLIPVESIDIYIELLELLKDAKESESERTFQNMRKKMITILDDVL
ncbi:MAG TPA: hypothetical protein PK718_01080 [Candidatus Methanofastidiosa archaeon]|mgnify:CR=1 FL=1|nr:hypothetical protein [Candidatus Methanofastidiosa archaeon]